MVLLHTEPFENPLKKKKSIWKGSLYKAAQINLISSKTSKHKFDFTEFQPSCQDVYKIHIYEQDTGACIHRHTYICIDIDAIMYIVQLSK